MIFPLRLKLALLTGSLLGVAIATVSLLMLNLLSESIESEVRKRGEFLVAQLADNARDPLLLQDDLVLGQLLERVAREPEIVVARVLDTEGGLVASTEAAEPVGRPRMTGEQRRAERTLGGRLVVASQMTFDGVDLGEAQVIVDIDSLIDPLVERARLQVLFASGLLLLLGLWIAFATSSRITRPLQRLRTAVKALAGGELSARVAPSSRDEVGELTRAFNEMSESLSQKQRIERAFRRYVSDHVLREVVGSPESIRLQGERREVTVLYIDIRKFTRLTSWIGPERLVAFLNEAFDCITRALLDHGATIDKYIGDAILAYLGAPIETSDHAPRALAAAIAVQRAVEDRNTKCEAMGEPFVQLELGIGIHTGLVVVGNIGSELKMDYTAIGEPVNIANRLQSLAQPGEIVISAEVRDHVSELVDVESLGSKRLEGLDHEVETFRVRY